jgi:hypothetical protein
MLKLLWDQLAILIAVIVFLDVMMANIDGLSENSKTFFIKI